MRPIHVAFTTAACALAACGGEQPAPQPPPPPPPTPTPIANPAAPPVQEPAPAPPKPTLADTLPAKMKALDDAFSARDAKALAGSFAEDCSAIAYGAPPAHGREEITKGLQGLFDAVGDAKSATTRLWIKGNVGIAEIAWAGTMTGDFLGMKASKKPVGQMRLHVMWFNDDGLIKEMHEYGDDVGLLAQMGGKKGAPPVPVLPTNPAEVHVAKDTPEEDKLADWAKGLDDSFSKDDAKSVMAMMADDGDAWLNFSGMPATRGKKDLAKELAGWFKAFPDQKWTATNVWGIDGYAIDEHTMSGTQKGPLGPLPASNKPVASWHWIDILQPSAEGKAQHDWGYANLVELTQQTGALKQPGEKPATTAPKPTADAATTKKK